MSAISSQGDALDRSSIASFCAAVAIAVGILLIPSPGAEARGLATGVTHFPAASPSEAAMEAARIKSAGSKFALHLISWSRVAPDNLPATWNPADPAAPEYDWTAIDNRVVADRAAGLVPALNIYGAPSWANRCRPEPGLFVLSNAPCDPVPKMLADFARAAAKRYSGNFGGSA